MLRRIALLLAASLLAQEQSLIRINVDLVQIDAVVTGKDGRVVRDLRAEDFEILQDGKPKPVSRFTFVDTTGAAPAPPGGLAAPVSPEQVRRSIVLLVDDLGLDFESMNIVRQGLKKFLAEGVRPGDFVALMRTGYTAGVLQGFTTDHRQLLALVDALQWNPLARTGGVTTGGGDAFMGISNEGIGAIARAEAARLPEDMFALGTIGSLEWIVQGLREMPGRKSVVLFSEGFKMSSADRASARVLDAARKVIELAARSATVIYTIDPRGPMTPDGPEQDERVLATRGPLAFLAAATGGAFYSNSNFVDRPLHDVMESQSGFYLLGYEPGGDSFDRKFHKLDVRVKRPGLRVRSRSGFLGTEMKEAEPGGAGDGLRQLAKAIRSPFHATAIPLKLTAVFLDLEKEGPVVQCMVRIQLGAVTFTGEPDGWKKGELEIVAVGFGGEGAQAGQSLKRIPLRLPKDRFDEIVSRGVLYTLKYPVKKPGPYQVRIAVRDPASSAIGSASQFLVAPNVAKPSYALSGVVLSRPGAAAADGEAAGRGDPATREFAAGDELQYGLQVFHANPARAKLGGHLRLLRDGKRLLEIPAALTVESERRAGRPIHVMGSTRLSAKLPPGAYALELMLTDESAPKPVTLSQWTDFTVIGAQ